MHLRPHQQNGREHTARRATKPGPEDAQWHLAWRRQTQPSRRLHPAPAAAPALPPPVTRVLMLQADEGGSRTVATTRDATTAEDDWRTHRSPMPRRRSPPCLPWTLQVVRSASRPPQRQLDLTTAAAMNAQHAADAIASFIAATGTRSRVCHVLSSFPRDAPRPLRSVPPAPVEAAEAIESDADCDHARRRGQQHNAACDRTGLLTGTLDTRRQETARTTTTEQRTAPQSANQWAQRGPLFVVRAPDSSDTEMVLTFKLAEDVVSTLRNVLLSRGFVEFIPGFHVPGSCNFHWKTTRFAEAELAAANPVSQSHNQPVHTSDQVQQRQKINHFQKTTGVCKKDDLARSLRRMAKTWGGALYSFSPETFILPREADELAAAMQRASASAADASNPVVWICKPSASSQGKNIFLITSMAQLSYDCSFVVQRYIANPMLIGGYKFDLRIYVLITSFRPLNVFLYREGLVRFSSAKYNSDLTNLFAHLTNASINKHSPDLSAEKDVIGSGCKWTIRTKWFDYLERVCGVNPFLIWEQIKELVLLTLLPIVSEVPDNPRSFELLGFDVMLDSDLKPWIIEVNASPALAISGAEDTQVKIPLLNDLITAVGFPASLCAGLESNGSNILAPNQTGFDPKAKQKARTAAIASAQAAVATVAAVATAAAAAAAAASEDATATPATHAAPPPRNANVQRIPRLVKLQSLGSTPASRAAAGAAPAATAASAFAAHSPRTRRAAHDSKDSLIPRMPSQSPPRSLSSSPPATATPSRIPLRTAQSDAAVAPASAATAVPPARATASRTKLSASSKARPALNSFGGGGATNAASTAAAARCSVARRSSVDAKAVPSSASAPAAAPPRAKPSSAATASSSTAGAGVASSAPVPASTASSSPALIGDFERIFPFDAATAAASEALAPSAAASNAAAARGSKAASSAQQPLALLLGSFARAVVTGIKSRARDRERTAAARARAREADPSLPLRQSFVPSSDVPSPWTPEALAAAVAAARAAAKAERARLGLPEPTQGQDAETEADEEALQVENDADASEPLPTSDDAVTAAAPATGSSSQPASPVEAEEEKQPEPIAAEC